MRTYRIDWERQAIQKDNVTLEELASVMAQIVVDDMNEYDIDNDEEVLKQYWIDVLEDGEVVESGLAIDIMQGDVWRDYNANVKSLRNE